MRIRVSFEYGAGVCLWADDAEARERWDSAVEFGAVDLPAELLREGEALRAEIDRSFFMDEREVQPRWSAEEAAGFQARAADWTRRVATALAPAGIAVADYGAERESGDEGPEFDGCVMACFTGVAARVAVERKELVSFAWEDTATWNGDTFKYRATERSPTEFLALLEREPGFVCGWWQASEGGPDAMLEGDPVEHAVACVRARNATGLANYLSWLRVERVHLGETLAGAEWTPARLHRLADAKGSWWEWFSFLRNAGAALRGGQVSGRYRKAERDRLFWKWTQGGSRAGWPATFGEAFERVGLRRKAFHRWARPAPS